MLNRRARMTTTTTTDSFYGGKTYGGSAPENYQRYFVPVIGGPFAQDLIADAALRPGERVLDVACGTGVVARLAAERVGPTGTVAALDLNPAMLSVARSVPSTGAAIRWYETSAESIPLPDEAFDVVFCQLGLQFVSDKSAALREMRRVLAPGGRVLVSTPPPNAFFDVLDEAVTRHVGHQAGAFVRMVFSLNDPGMIERLFRDAGFADVNVRTYAKELRLPPAREFLWQYVHCTPLTGMLAGLDAGRIAAFQREVVDRWARWSDADGMKYEQGMIVSTARK
jgi:ubiquinone/menaquinone biosynthesis C-methylase UbiE